MRAGMYVGNNHEGEHVNDNKKFKTAMLPLIVGASTVLALIILLAAFSSYDALVKDSDGSFYRAHALFIAGDALICVRDGTTYASRKDALAGKEDDKGLAFFSMKKIDFIEIIRDQEAGGFLPGWQPTLQDYVGDYVINAAGNHGYLSLRAGKGYLYGTVRFPEWGRGVTEYLKNVRIAGGKIYFTRSAVTRNELNRLGMRYSFIQEYSGEYYRSGNAIRGFYTVNGARKAWEAVKGR